MPFLLLGLVLGAPLGAIGYLYLLAKADKVGAREANRENAERRKRVR